MDKQLEMFYKSLTPREREAHDIIAKGLGSSYKPTKTRAFLKWLDEQKKQNVKK
jgi:hypothetical protein